MRLVMLAVAVLATGCPGKGGYPQPSRLPSADEVLARLAKTRAGRKAFRAESVMDYWLGKQRVKGTVFVMGTDQRQVRFNAISPQQDVLADMACDGASFSFVNMQQNCQLAGPCNKQSVATLLRVELEPEDVLHLALGTVPVLEQATGTVTWDASKGYERVKLTSAAGAQTIVIDAREGRSDILSSELVGPDGKTVWSVENTDFEGVKDDAGGTHRLPGKTRFKSPAQQADLLVEWKERVVNPTLDPAKFKVVIPEGLPTCK
ncbi:MAG: DUF4292 domain-containing protein [Deltaproteobacteria bacterium]|nr:DUF4292 domain-containing protein [Deltaproteobacteria bacterium]